jgi:hypothetical protein
MSAVILALPTAAPAPVAQRRRRGPLPKTVPSLGAYRHACEQEQQERAVAHIEAVRTLVYEVFQRAMQGKTSGLVIVESQGGEHWTGQTTGDLGTRRPDDLARLGRAVEWLAGAVSATAAKRQKP